VSLLSSLLLSLHDSFFQYYPYPNFKIIHSLHYSFYSIIQFNNTAIQLPLHSSVRNIGAENEITIFFILNIHYFWFYGETKTHRCMLNLKLKKDYWNEKSNAYRWYSEIQEMKGDMMIIMTTLKKLKSLVILFLKRQRERVREYDNVTGKGVSKLNTDSKALTLLRVVAGYLEFLLHFHCERNSAPEEMESVWFSTTGSAVPRVGFLAILLLSLLLCTTFSSTGTALLPPHSYINFTSSEYYHTSHFLSIQLPWRFRSIPIFFKAKTCKNNKCLWFFLSTVFSVFF